jgi:peptidoglycan glycosyltransferase
MNTNSMNKPIRRVFLVVVFLFALLAFYTARWTVFEARSLNQNTLNKIPAQKNAKKPRGAIYAAGGRTLARSRRMSSGEYVRSYPTGPLLAHPVGYSYSFYGQSGLEKYWDDQLTGRSMSVGSLLDSVFGRGGEQQNMVTNLDVGAQRLSEQLMAGKHGAVVVLDPATGQIPVYLSVPSYNPELMGTRTGVRSLNRDGEKPLVDRVSYSTYPPGSTFKIVTAAAALDSGRITTTSTVDGNSPQTFASKPLKNDFNQQFGPTDLKTAITYSVNTAFGNIGVKLGKETLLKYMKRFGFYAPPPVDLPRGELLASGLRGPDGNLLPPNANIDLARTAIGQERLAVTPLQMATVAATVANRGVRMEPRIARLFRDEYGRTTMTVSPKKATRVIKPQTAAELNAMMRRVVEEGTGRAANVGTLKMAGKTGTAELGNDLNQAWFIGFAPYDRPRYAVAVSIEDSTEFGGAVAAPIAAQVLQYLLRNQ